MHIRAFAAAAAAGLALSQSASAQLVFDFDKGPGFLALEISDPTKAAAMYAAAVSAGSKFSSIFADPVTLKYTLEYAPSMTPPGVLAYADSTFVSVPFPSVKGALIGDATSPHDFTAIGSLPAGASVPHYRNDSFDFAFPEFEPFLDLTPSPNNTTIDLAFSNGKAMGMIPGDFGGPGSDATLVVSDAAFDFDHTDGIDGDKFDFHGVMLHEIAHAMGFISGTDTVATLFPSPPMDPELITMLTVLDLYRYSPLSATMGARDISLPLPGAEGPPSVRYFSIDGGMGSIDEFSTGDGVFGFGDGQQGGHWKDDGTFGLMDPTLALGFDLSAAWEALIASGLAPDLTALDVIGWTYVPSPGSGCILAIGGLALLRRRR